MTISSTRHRTAGAVGACCGGGVVDTVRAVMLLARGLLRGRNAHQVRSQPRTPAPHAEHVAARRVTE